MDLSGNEKTSVRKFKTLSFKFSGEKDVGKLINVGVFDQVNKDNQRCTASFVNFY